MVDWDYWAICECYVWYMRGLPRGKCGRCGEKPKGTYYTKNEATLAFTALHGHAPKPITKENK